MSEEISKIYFRRDNHEKYWKIKEEDPLYSFDDLIKVFRKSTERELEVKLILIKKEKKL